MQKVFLRNLSRICEIAAEEGMPLVVTFQPHISYSVSLELYEWVTRIIHSRPHTQSFLDNVLRPVAQLLKKFQHIILYDIYAEPEGDVAGPRGNGQSYGGTWEQLQNYIRLCAGILKGISPEVPVTAASGWREYDSLREGIYNDLGLDCVGVDIYNDTGELQKADTLGTNAPVWLAEYGTATKDNWDNAFLSFVTERFLLNARTKGYIGAFFWMYGYPESEEALSLIGRNGALRLTAEEMKRMIQRCEEAAICRTSTIPGKANGTDS